MDRKDDGGSRINPRAQVGIVIGYIAMIMGLLAVVAEASEATALPLNLAAAIVLLHRAAGFAIGWLIQPLLSRWFSA